MPKWTYSKPHIFVDVTSEEKVWIVYQGDEAVVSELWEHEAERICRMHNVPCCKRCNYELQFHCKGIGLTEEEEATPIPCEYCWLKERVAELERALTTQKQDAYDVARQQKGIPHESLGTKVSNYIVDAVRKH
jgi:hypothetical protein